MISFDFERLNKYIAYYNYCMAFIQIEYEDAKLILGRV